MIVSLTRDLYPFFTAMNDRRLEWGLVALGGLLLFLFCFRGMIRALDHQNDTANGGNPKRWVPNDSGNSGLYWTPMRYFGLKWVRMVEEPDPSHTEELVNAALSSALSKQMEFSEKEWGDFQIKNLRKEHFVQSGEWFFKPVGRPTRRVMQSRSRDTPTCTNFSMYLERRHKEANALLSEPVPEAQPNSSSDLASASLLPMPTSVDASVARAKPGRVMKMRSQAWLPPPSPLPPPRLIRPWDSPMDPKLVSIYERTGALEGLIKPCTDEVDKDGNRLSARSQGLHSSDDNLTSARSKQPERWVPPTPRPMEQQRKAMNKVDFHVGYIDYFRLLHEAEKAERAAERANAPSPSPQVRKSRKK